MSHEKPWAGAPPVETAVPSGRMSCALPSTPPTASATPSTRRTAGRTSWLKGARSWSEITEEPCTTTSVFA